MHESIITLACPCLFVKDCHADMLRMEDERKVLQDSLQKSADEVTAQLAVTTAKNTDLEKVKQVIVIPLHKSDST